MLIKVCGMRNAENIGQLYAVGIRMMGFIFFDKSKRNIEPQNRLKTLLSVPPDVKKVGVFVNEELAEVKRCISEFHLDYVQLHGEEDPDYCKSVKDDVGVIKAFRIEEDFDFASLTIYQDCDYFLFDAKGKEYGGNGIKYDWSLLQSYDLKTPFLLSGGIGPNDVEQILAFDHSRFAGIDVNSRFEIEPGLKNIEKISSFKNQIECNIL